MTTAEIIADSIGPMGNRLTTFKITFPRIVLAEFNTHRMFSRNTSSSRAIPFKKMVESIQKNPFIPIAWQKPHKGMQGSEYYDHTLTEEVGGIDYTNLPERWLRARDTAVSMAKIMADEKGNMPVTKQLANRLLEPFMWVTMIVTTGKEGLENFFDLRCPKYGDSVYGKDKCSIFCKSKKEYAEHFNISVDYQTNLQWLKHNYSQAEIHIQQLAELMYDAYNESIPKRKSYGEWHIPWENKIEELYLQTRKKVTPNKTEFMYKIATAMSARVSYTLIDGGEKFNVEKDIKLHDRLLEERHMSPFEHCARTMSNEEYETHYKGILSKGLDYYHPQEEDMGWCRNFKGFIQYREFVEI